MKRLVVLLLVLVGGVIAAALAIPTNAAVVNGSAISQQTLNADVQAIAASTDYQCYLSAEAYLSSGGSSQLPPVEGAGSALNPGHPTATSAFVAVYLDTEISHQLVFQAAARRGVTVTQSQLDQARVALETQITNQLGQAFQAGAQTGNSALTCGVGTPLTGQQVLATMPASFVDQEVRFVATASALQEDVAGVGSSDADLQRYFDAHRSEFDTVCFDYAAYATQQEAQSGAAAVAFGTPFSKVAASAAQSGSLRCAPLSDLASVLQTSLGSLDHLAVGQVSAPLQAGGGWVLLVPASRVPTPFAQARQAVARATQQAGGAATQKALAAAQRGASVEVNPQYGVWVPGVATVFTPLTPRPADVPNAPANEPAGAVTSNG